jgi:NAD(P)-dependent dehydrogenase (short-subunit alcohol dehydrogenase family)
MTTGRLTGRTILLTGASGGIGSVTARALGAAGADLIAHYRSDRAGAEAAVAEIPAERRLLLQADLSATGSSRALWQEAVAWKGRIDVVVVNAAMLARTPFDGSDEQWDDGWAESMRVNVVEPASLAREAVKHYVEHGSGTIITISSWAAQAGSALPQVPAYAASKAAIRNLTQTIARNFAKDGVLAYVVAPGIVKTPMAEISAEARGGIDKVHAALAMGEMVPPGEVAELVAFLATGTVRHLTGATLDMNGATYVR